MAPRPLRICLIGPESTGKTELSLRLARELGAAYAAEFAREYVELHGNDLTADDLPPIARGELANLDAVRAADLAILDTDLLSTVAYGRYYYGTVPRWIEEEARKRRADCYLLMDTDLEWLADPCRDTPGEDREEQFDLFRAVLDEFETHWTIVSGDGEARWQAVLQHARSHLDPQ